MIVVTPCAENFKNLFEAIYKEGYYIDLFESVLPVDYKSLSDREIVDVCNEFWCALPDSMSIHREPFTLLCDISEGSFLEENDLDG